MTLTVIVVQKYNEDQHERAVVQMFEQRARIFRDKLGWDVTVYNGQETDQYDDLDPVYLICTEEGPHQQVLFVGDDIAHDDVTIVGSPREGHIGTRSAGAGGSIPPRSTIVTGSLRLLPTTGPTLLADAFADTLPDAMFSAPSIWEVSRFCSEDYPRTATALIAALGEVCLKSGIESIVSNFSAEMLRVYRRIGIEVNVLGKTTRYGEPVYLGIFPVTAEILARVKSRMAAMARVAA